MCLVINSFSIHCLDVRRNLSTFSPIISYGKERCKWEIPRRGKIWEKFFEKERGRRSEPISTGGNRRFPHNIYTPTNVDIGNGTLSETDPICRLLARTGLRCVEVIDCGSVNITPAFAGMTLLAPAYAEEWNDAPLFILLHLAVSC